MDVFDKCYKEGGYLGMFRAAKDKYYTRPILSLYPGTEMEFNGIKTIIWSLNNYLGLAKNEEIKKIADCGGVVGIIFMNHWLAMGDQKNGLDLVVKTIQHVADKGGIDSVAIGSDFDGFTDPPDDIKDSSEYPKLIPKLESAGFNTGDIEKIFMKNAIRVFENGWGKIN